MQLPWTYRHRNNGCGVMKNKNSLINDGVIVTGALDI